MVRYLPLEVENSLHNVGVWGMNFRRMPELEWEYGYPAAWAAMLLIGAVVYLIFRKKEWR